MDVALVLEDRLSIVNISAQERDRTIFAFYALSQQKGKRSLLAIELHRSLASERAVAMQQHQQQQHQSASSSVYLAR